MKDPTQPSAILLFFEVETPSTHISPCASSSHGRALLRGRKQRHHHLLFLCRPRNCEGRCRQPRGWGAIHTCISLCNLGPSCAISRGSADQVQWRHHGARRHLWGVHVGDGKHNNRVAHWGVDVACMDVCCFEEESSDTIIYCFCADLETVKGAVVNPEVETPSTPVSPCATSGLPWQRRSSAVEAPRSQTPSLRHILDVMIGVHSAVQT